MSLTERRRLLGALEILLSYLPSSDQILQQGGMNAGSALHTVEEVSPDAGNCEPDGRADGGVREDVPATQQLSWQQLPLLAAVDS